MKLVKRSVTDNGDGTCTVRVDPGERIITIERWSPPYGSGGWGGQPMPDVAWIEVQAP